MTTVNGKLVGPAAAAPSNSAVCIALVDYDNNVVVGFNTTDKTEILSTLAVPVNTDGTWTASLVPNSEIELAGGAKQTAWRITEVGAGADGTYGIVVSAGGPFWVGDLRTTLVGTTPIAVAANLAVAGALSVGGTFSLDGVTFAAPPNDASKFLASDGTWRVGGGAVASVNGHVGTVVLSASDVSAVPTTAEGAAGGVATLDGSGLLTAGQLPTGLIHATRLDQFAAPTAAVAMGGQKLTGGAAGTAGTDFATVSQLPASPRDRRSAMLGLLGQPFDYGAINDIGLGLTSGFMILMLCMPDAGSVAALDLLLGGAGSGVTGVSNVCAFSEDGSTRLAASGDVTTQLSTVGNANTVLRLPFAAPFTADGSTSFYFGILCQMSSNPTIGGVFASLHLPAVGSHRPGIVVGGGSLSSVPSTIDVAGASAAGASYWLAPSS